MKAYKVTVKLGRKVLTSVKVYSMESVVEIQQMWIGENQPLWNEKGLKVIVEIVNGVD